MMLKAQIYIYIGEYYEKINDNVSYGVIDFNISRYH